MSALVDPPCTSFYAHRLRAPALLWTSRLAQSNADIFGRIQNGMVARISDPYFPPTMFNLDQPAIVMDAESYGGVGISFNGGGVRVGNLDDVVQVKGIGRNPLAGAASHAAHQYGGLLIDQAAIEIVFSLLVDKLLPHGACPLYGLATTGIDFAFDARATDLAAWRREGGKGALLFRRRQLRPAHFLQNRAYEPMAHRPLLYKDLERCRSMIRRVDMKRRFHRLLENFVARSARQFAFAKVYGLMHGALSASNLTMNGEWIDLSFCTVVPPGANRKLYPGHIALSDENYYPALVASEVHYAFNKFGYHRHDFGSRFAEAYQRHYQKARVDAFFHIMGLEVKIQESDLLTLIHLCGRIFHNNPLRIGGDALLHFRQWLGVVQALLVAPLFERKRVLARYVTRPETELIAYMRMVIKMARLQLFTHEGVTADFVQKRFSAQDTLEELHRYETLIEEVFSEDEQHIALSGTLGGGTAKRVFDKRRLLIKNMASGEVEMQHDVDDPLARGADDIMDALLIFVGRNAGRFRDIWHATHAR